MSVGYKDLPIEGKDQDTLGLMLYAKSLSDFVKNCDTPMTIAIQGDWGSGKTSMMNMIKENLGKNVIPVWFNTWHYSQFDMGSYLSLSLINNFLEELQPEKSVLDGFKKFMGYAVKNAMTIAIEKTAGETLAGQFADRSPLMDMANELKSLKVRIEKVVKDKIAKAGESKKIVVFVDDLDRLPPDKAIEVLEVMKNFLDLEGCVFILAVDYGIVVQGVKKKYGQDVEEAKGRSFFDKIIQLPFVLPIGQYDVTKYIEKFLADNADFSPRNKTAKNLNIMQGLIGASIGFNPRSIKRLFNSYTLLTSVMEAKYKKNENLTIKKDDRQRILFAILCMQMAFDVIYDYLLDNLDSIDDMFLSSLMSEPSLRENEVIYNHIKKSKNFQEHQLPRIANFFESFYTAIQCDDNGEDLSIDEVNNFREVMAYSSITSSRTAASFDDTNKLIRFDSVASYIKYLKDNDFNPKVIKMLEAIYNQVSLKYVSESEINISKSCITFKNKSIKTRAIKSFISIAPQKQSIDIVLNRSDSPLPANAKDHWSTAYKNVMYYIRLTEKSDISSELPESLITESFARTQMH